MSALSLLVALGSCCLVTGLFLGRPLLRGPSVALVGEIVTFECELTTYPVEESIQLQIFKDNDRTVVFGENPAEAGEASIPKVIQLSHEGYLECVARVKNNSQYEPTVSNRHYLRVIEPVQGAKITVMSGPKEFFEGKTLELHCNLVAGNHVSYRWLLNGQTVPQSDRHHHVHNKLYVYSTTSQDSGSYICVASNFANETMVFTSKAHVQIRVRDVVSNPDISFTVMKEDHHNYSALVLCQSTRGTTPITFSLYRSKELVRTATVDGHNSTFKLPLVLGRHLGWLQCQANNGDHTSYSQWLALEVEPVGGPVELRYDHDVGEDYAVIGLRFYCEVAKGTHVRYQWFLNSTTLEGRGSFYWVVERPPRESVLLLSVGRSSAGTYQCVVSDTFDNTTLIRSRRYYIDRQVLNRLPTLVVAIVFGCFAFIIAMVSACCMVGVVFRRRQDREKSHSKEEREAMVAAYEDDLDSAEYSEDADVVNAAKVDGLDEVSDGSVDEWPQIRGRKKTLEGEMIERSEDKC